MTTPSLTTKRYRWALAVVILVGLALRLAWVLWATRAPSGEGNAIFLDPFRYLGYARQIADGHGYTEPLTGDPTTYYPPGYPIFLGILTWVSQPFTDSPWMVAGLVQAALGAASVWLLAFTTKRLAGPVAALVGAVLYALYPNLIFHTGALLGETLYNFLFLAFLAVLFGKQWTESFSMRRIVGSGVLLGLAVLVRPISLAIIPVVVLGWLLARKDYRVTVRWTLALVAGVLLCIVPWTVRNAVKMDAFVPISTNTGDNLCMGHGEGATGKFGGLESCDVPYRFLDGKTAEVGSDKAKQRIAIRSTFEHVDREPWLFWRRTYFTWVRDGDHDALFAVQSYRQDRWMAIPTEHRLMWIADRSYWLVVAAGIVGLVQLARRRDPQSLVMVGSTLMTALIPLLFFGDQRFKVPVIPLLIIAAACLADGRWGLGRRPATEADGAVPADEPSEPSEPAAAPVE